MKKKIAVLKGDGIGPEIVTEALKVLKKIGEKCGHEFETEELFFGGASIDKYGEPLTDETLNICKNSDAVLLGAVGGPKWDNVDKDKRPEKGLLKIRKELGLFANLRPTKLYKELENSCPLKKEIIKSGIDFVMIRELTGGVYFGKKETKEVDGMIVATDEMKYTEEEIRRIGVIAFDTARKRNKKVTSIDKSNVLDTSKLWRKIMHELSEKYSDVKYEDMLVDSASMQIIKNPSGFDVVVTENMFGDILSDEASVLAGSIGMMPSASLGSTKLGLYEPIHGSAPDIAGLNISNPIGTILSVAMMFRYSFDMENEALLIEKAVEKVLADGYRTTDLFVEGTKKLSCSEMGDTISKTI
ncbi:MAG: 3-isopropylmalate dehydrogenase [Lachnospiraceae bacterium]|nr:3-isopropylmalate dehydrogenase [Lachnospiraceae bacterium]